MFLVAYSHLCAVGASGAGAIHSNIIQRTEKHLFFALAVLFVTPNNVVTYSQEDYSLSTISPLECWQSACQLLYDKYNIKQSLFDPPSTDTEGIQTGADVNDPALFSFLSFLIVLIDRARETAVTDCLYQLEAAYFEQF